MKYLMNPVEAKVLSAWTNYEYEYVPVEQNIPTVPAPRFASERWEREGDEKFPPYNPESDLLGRIF